ncbi:MAG: CDP-alcohol phosphatidyltransferase family protein [Thermocrinis sp.]|nr:CDP-alcohol phosphatidyltransferase family protein [Thermocrinis sp.]
MANYITLFRFLLIFLTVPSILNQHHKLAFLLILLGALSDWLDGDTARKRNEVSKLGVLLDPFVDKVFVLSCLSAYLYLGQVSPYAFILLLIRELYISFLRSFAVEKGYLMSASFLGKLKTFAEFTTLVLFALGSPLGTLVLWISILLAYLSALDYTLSLLRCF